VFSHKLTQDTHLRLLEERHAEELTDLTDRNREHLRTWLPLPWVDTNRTVEDRKNFIRGALEQFAHNKGFTAGIWHEGRLVGVISYNSIDWENRSVAVGYWLGEEYQGKGLVTAACRALVEHAFFELGLNRVIILCATENEKSCAVAERLGFRREGVRRQAAWLYDRFVDLVSYSALASRWSTRHS
jgi:ribosomal-protein-serine acetyltransferase